MVGDVVIDLNLFEALFVAGVTGFGIGAGIIALKVAIDWVRTREIDKQKKAQAAGSVDDIAGADDAGSD